MLETVYAGRALIGGNMRSLYRSMTAALKPRMLPLGIPLYTLLFCSLYMIVYPASTHGRAFWTENLIENALHVALVVSWLCLTVEEMLASDDTLI